MEPESLPRGAIDVLSCPAPSICSHDLLKWEGPSRERPSPCREMRALVCSTCSILSWLSGAHVLSLRLQKPRGSGSGPPRSTDARSPRCDLGAMTGCHMRQLRLLVHWPSSDSWLSSDMSGIRPSAITGLLFTLSCCPSWLLIWRLRSSLGVLICVPD